MSAPERRGYVSFSLTGLEIHVRADKSILNNAGCLHCCQRLRRLLNSRVASDDAGAVESMECAGAGAVAMANVSAG